MKSKSFTIMSNRKKFAVVCATRFSTFNLWVIVELIKKVSHAYNFPHHTLAPSWFLGSTFSDLLVIYFIQAAAQKSHVTTLYKSVRQTMQRRRFWELILDAR